MPPASRPPNPEREHTDESLRAEREKADEALGERDSAAGIDELADAVIDKARARADELLARARAKTDRSAADAPGAERPSVVARERVREDEAVREERADADETLRAERAAHADLLEDEREKTDEDLSHERDRSDEALQTRDEFMGIVSHDLRNLLNAVMGFAALIESEAPRENQVEHVVKHAQRIRRSGGRMARLIGDLVDVASIEAGTLAVTREVLDPAPVLMEAVDTFQTRAGASGISLVAEVVAPLPTAAFDPARVLQVLINLLSNAIKFTAAGGKVVARVERVGDDLRFAVEDTGEGIAADKLEAIFERYLQVTKGDRRGVGLGLFISECIVHGHGGKIWAESVVGVGSRFFFTLPIAVAR